MSEKFAIKLGNVQKTLFLPLWGRAVETQKKEPLLVDRTAVEIIDGIDYDFSTITSNISDVSQYGWIGRSLSVDKIVKGFIEAHPKSTIVNIGCGLDTTFERIDNGSIYWFDLDLPDVIELRRKFIHESERRKCISGSFLDYEWLNQLKGEDNILFIAAGVLYYFEEHQIKNFFSRIADLFPEGEIVFDATPPLGIKMANKMVIKSSGMDEKSFLKWGLKRAEEIRQWDNRIKIMDEVSVFSGIKKSLNFKSRMGILISDMLKMQYMVHLKITSS